MNPFTGRFIKKEGSEIRLLDKLEEKEKREDKILDLIVLKELLETLDEEEKQLIFLRYFADRTQSDVGKIMGISQVQVSRSEKRIIEKLRKKRRKIKESYKIRQRQTYYSKKEVDLLKNAVKRSRII